MADPGVKRSGGEMVAAGLFAGLALAVFVFTSFPRAVQSNWLDYYRAFKNLSGAGLLAGGLWLVLAILKRRTDFFDVQRMIGDRAFAMAVGLTVMGMVVALAGALYFLPALCPPVSTVIDAVERARLLRLDRGLKLLVSAAVLLTGVSILSVPLRRKFRVDGPYR